MSFLDLGLSSLSILFYQVSEEGDINIFTLNER